MDSDLLKSLCCPETHQEVRLAEAPVIEELNRRMASGELRNRAGQVVREKIDGALVRADGKYVYVVRQDIPVMLVEESIPLQGP